MRQWRVTIVVLTGACGYWGHRPLDQPTPVQNGAPVWIWSGAAVRKWHAVVITEDSVVGIPYEDPVSCYLCRLAIPRASVDSMELGYKTGFQKLAWGVTRDVGIVAGVLIVYAGLWALAGWPRDC